MLKKLGIISVLGSSLLFANYYSVVDVTLETPKIIQYSKNLVLKLKDNKISINKYKFLFDSDEARQYNDTIFTKVVEVLDEKTDKKIKQHQQVSYPTYNFIYVLKNHPTGEFVVKLAKGEILVKTKQNTDTINVFNHSYDVTKYEYKIEKVFGVKNIDEDYLLKSYIDDNGDLLAIDILDNGIQKVQKVTDKYLEKYLYKKSVLQTKVKQFKFDNQKLYLSYVAYKDGNSKRLNVEYSKVNNFTKISLKSPVSLLDPENKSDDILENIGFLIPARGNLWEIKKVQLQDSQPDEIWQNSPKSSKLSIIYVKGTQESRKIVFKDRNQMFYGFEGVFYLASWMKQTNKSKVVLSFVNGPVVFDATMQKDGDYYELTKQGNVIYKFRLDNKGFITNISYPSYDLNIKLDGIDNDTTLKNKKYLKSFSQIHNIELIKD